MLLLIAIEKLKNPNNLAYALLDSYADLYQLFFNESTTDYNTLYPQFKKRINIFKQGPKNSPFYLYSFGLLHLHKAVAAVRFDRNWEAALDFRKAYFMSPFKALNNDEKSWGVLGYYRIE